MNELCKNNYYLGSTLVLGRTERARANPVVIGTVSSPEEGPLPGVNVLLKGTSIGTTTDSKGRYSISIPDDEAILTFSSIGSVPKKLI